MSAEATYRVEAYLTEIEEHNRKPHALKYADEIHGLNDQALRISDLREIFDKMRAHAQQNLRADVALRDLEDERDALRNALSWIHYQAALHHLGGAFDPVHMLAIANTAGDALAGREMPDYTEAMEAAQERATEWAEKFAEWANEEAQQ